MPQQWLGNFCFRATAEASWWAYREVLKHVVCLQNTGNNEIDRALLDLLQQNIDAAKQAGQAEPAVFMEKVRDAARKFVLT